MDISLEDFLKNRSALSLIIDARSPCEYKESHIPGAINVPVLSDNEHKEVGTLYRSSPFEARILGASLICANVSKYLLELKSTLHPSQKIGIYCARGGQRSQSLSIILSSIGYRVNRLNGGYKCYRAYVANALQEERTEQFLTLVAPTGSGKSEIIEAITWSLDIEGLTSHMGSSFGDIRGGQPSAKMFQNLLYERLCALKDEPLIAVEAESKKLGNLTIPSPLYERYKNAPKVFVDSPLQSRIDRICKVYAGISPRFFYEAMGRISRYMRREAWEAAARAFEVGDLPKCAELLLVEYYDKVYKLEPCDYTISFSDLDSAKSELEAIKADILDSCLR